jgi:hypothetical protein
LNLSLHAIARVLGGSVRGNKVVAPGPEAATHKVKWKRKRNTLAVWGGDDGDIRVHSHTGQDPIATKDWVRRKCGLPAWQPKKRKPKPLPPLAERGQFLSESLRIARNRDQITFDQFALIINDLKNACSDAALKPRADLYAREFDFSPAEIEAALRPQWRAHTAAERAVIFQIAYDEYRHLCLRRSGCIELDPSERRRLTKQRYNAKRRAERHAKRISQSADQRAPLCPTENVGTVRMPSSEGVVSSVVSRDREPGKWLLKDTIRVMQKSADARRTHSPENRCLTAIGQAPNAAFAQITKPPRAEDVGHALLRRLEAEGVKLPQGQRGRLSRPEAHQSSYERLNDDQRAHC